MKENKQKKKQRYLSKQQTMILTAVLSVGILLLTLYEFQIFGSADNHDLSLIGKGRPVVVHVHDPQ